jgi:hypothetical protein
LDKNSLDEKKTVPEFAGRCQGKLRLRSKPDSKKDRAIYSDFKQPHTPNA